MIVTAHSGDDQTTTTIGTLRQRQLRKLADKLASDGFEDAKQRILDLEERLDSPHLTARIALCGLFSAGKSSLINALVGETVTATGAVPTTAMIHEIEWNVADSQLVLMDTPGIDSTDEAHQQVTEAALHMADVVCLVVDYSHVESEETLEFGRMLCQRGVPLYVLVHQVDKHLDFELSFDAFARRVETTLEDYGISYVDLYYTSVAQSAHNQLQQVKSRLAAIAANATEVVMQSSVSNAVSVIRQAVVESLSDKRFEVEQSVLDSVGELPLDDLEAKSWLDDLEGQLQRLQEEFDAGKEALADSHDAAITSFDRSVLLGQIAPYDTTERGRMFVESLRKDFKVGWLNAKKKTEEEQARRLQEFKTDIQERLRQNLVWPLQREVRSYVLDTNLASDGWQNHLDELDIEIPESLFFEAVNKGALESEQYPYQYVKEVVNRVKALVRTRLNQIVRPWLDVLLKAYEAAHEEDVREMSQLQRQVSSLSAWMRLVEEERERTDAYKSYLTP